MATLTAAEAREAGFVPKPTPPRGRAAAPRTAGMPPPPTRASGPLSGLKATPARGATADKGGEKSSRVKRAEAVEQTFGLLSAGLTLLGMGLQQPVLLDDAGACAVHAEQLAGPVADYAETNAFVAGILDRLETINGIGALALVGMPFALQIMVNHRATTDEGKARVSEMAETLGQFGVLEPHVLRAKVKAEHQKKMAEMQADLLRAQRDAESDLESIKSEMASS